MASVQVVLHNFQWVCNIWKTFNNFIIFIKICVFSYYFNFIVLSETNAQNSSKIINGLPK